MPLITVVFYLVVVGVLLWLLNSYVPMAAPIKTIINVLVIVVVVLWLVGLFIPLGGGPTIGRVR